MVDFTEVIVAQGSRPRMMVTITIVMMIMMEVVVLWVLTTCEPYTEKNNRRTAIVVKSEDYKNAPMSYFHYETIVPGGVGVKGRIVQPHRSHDAAGDDRGRFTLLGLWWRFQSLSGFNMPFLSFVVRTSLIIMRVCFQIVKSSNVTINFESFRFLNGDFRGKQLDIGP